MNIQITIPDAVATRAVNAFCIAEGYAAQVELTPGVLTPNPETKANFARRKLAEWVKGRIVRGEADIAARIAQTTAENAANSEIAVS